MAQDSFELALLKFRGFVAVHAHSIHRGLESNFQDIGGVVYNPLLVVLQRSAIREWKIAQQLFQVH